MNNFGMLMGMSEGSASSSPSRTRASTVGAKVGVKWNVYVLLWHSLQYFLSKLRVPMCLWPMFVPRWPQQTAWDSVEHACLVCWGSETDTQNMGLWPAELKKPHDFSDLPQHSRPAVSRKAQDEAEVLLSPKIHTSDKDNCFSSPPYKIKNVTTTERR